MVTVNPALGNTTDGAFPPTDFASGADPLLGSVAVDATTAAGLNTSGLGPIDEVVEALALAGLTTCVIRATSATHTHTHRYVI